MLTQGVRRYCVFRFVKFTLWLTLGLLLIQLGVGMLNVKGEAPVPVDVPQQVVWLGVVSTDGHGSIDTLEGKDPDTKSQHFATMGYWPSAIETEEDASLLSLEGYYAKYVQGFEFRFPSGLNSQLPMNYTALGQDQSDAFIALSEELSENLSGTELENLGTTASRAFYTVAWEAEVEESYPKGASVMLFNGEGNNVGFGCMWDSEFNFVLYGDVAPKDSIYAFPAAGGSRNFWLSVMTVHGAAANGHQPPSVWRQYRPGYF